LLLIQQNQTGIMGWFHFMVASGDSTDEHGEHHCAQKKLFHRTFLTEVSQIIACNSRQHKTDAWKGSDLLLWWPGTKKTCHLTWSMAQASSRLEEPARLGHPRYKCPWCVPLLIARL